MAHFVSRLVKLLEDEYGTSIEGSGCYRPKRYEMPILVANFYIRDSKRALKVRLLGPPLAPTFPTMIDRLIFVGLLPLLFFRHSFAFTISWIGESRNEGVSSLCPHTPSSARQKSFAETVCVSMTTGKQEQSEMSVTLVERLDLLERFDRWRFLQNFLDAEIDSDIMNEILYAVLDGALKYPPLEDDDDAGFPEMTPELKANIERVLELGHDRKLPAFEGPDCGPGSPMVLERLERILPDPEEEQDANRSLWDTMLELHGREMVKINEKEGTLEWRTLCVVARVLLHYDFLTYGIAEGPRQPEM